MIIERVLSRYCRYCYCSRAIVVSQILVVYLIFRGRTCALRWMLNLFHVMKISSKQTNKQINEERTISLCSAIRCTHSAEPFFGCWMCVIRWLKRKNAVPVKPNHITFLSLFRYNMSHMHNNKRRKEIKKQKQQLKLQNAITNPKAKISQSRL